MRKYNDIHDTHTHTQTNYSYFRNPSDVRQRNLIPGVYVHTLHISHNELHVHAYGVHVLYVIDIGRPVGSYPMSGSSLCIFLHVQYTWEFKVHRLNRKVFQTKTYLMTSVSNSLIVTKICSEQIRELCSEKGVTVMCTKLNLAYTISSLQPCQ